MLGIYYGNKNFLVFFSKYETTNRYKKRTVGNETLSSVSMKSRWESDLSKPRIKDLHISVQAALDICKPLLAGNGYLSLNLMYDSEQDKAGRPVLRKE